MPHSPLEKAHTSHCCLPHSPAPASEHAVTVSAAVALLCNHAATDSGATGTAVSLAALPEPQHTGVERTVLTFFLCCCSLQHDLLLRRHFILVIQSQPQHTETACAVTAGDASRAALACSIICCCSQLMLHAGSIEMATNMYCRASSCLQHTRQETTAAVAVEQQQE